MSDASYIGWSLVVGFGLTLIVVVRWFNGGILVGWKACLLAAALFVFGFSLVRTFGGIILGDAALPSWSIVAKDFWVVVIGASIIVDSKSNIGFLDSKSRLIGGLVLVAVGTLQSASTFFDVLHGA